MCARPVPDPRHLLVARASGLALWDWERGCLSAPSLNAETRPSSEESSGAHSPGPDGPSLTCACWLADGSRAAAGHADGHVSLWAFVDGPSGPDLLRDRVLRPGPPGSPLSPVTALHAVGGPTDNLLVAGAASDGPDGLTLLPTLPDPRPGVPGPSLRDPVALPWLGFLRGRPCAAPLTAPGAIGPHAARPAAAVLLEGGRCFVYDLWSLAPPTPLAVGLQAKPPVTASVLTVPRPVLLNPSCPVWITEHGLEDLAALARRYPAVLPCLSPEVAAAGCARSVERERDASTVAGMLLEDMLKARGDARGAVPDGCLRCLVRARKTHVLPECLDLPICGAPQLTPSLPRRARRRRRRRRARASAGTCL